MESRRTKPHHTYGVGSRFRRDDGSYEADTEADRQQTKSRRKTRPGEVWVNREFRFVNPSTRVNGREGRPSISYRWSSFDSNSGDAVVDPPNTSQVAVQHLLCTFAGWAPCNLDKNSNLHHSRTVSPDGHVSVAQSHVHTASSVSQWPTRKAKRYRSD